ncbi:hypothetical protein LTR56_008056 [Elasticomyces elasticus]|nr:hypothetical protein LTR56_008056 [Elasticomyces elasticus]KAK3665811.1 hypothetical protein LTR22_003442 [Elasticomyces elasticus]KAK4926271.1 hypothetical protein LTR49_006743 [Elasticomyces elasticus]KAK5761993.1 hypothetical protein LTS12_007865 [Elasticomyces elasticus]
MSGVHRFLSRRDKTRPAHLQQQQQQQQQTRKAEPKPDHFGGIFTVEHDPKQKPDKEHEKKIKAILDRLRYNGIDTMVESNAEYALRASHGDGEAAYKLLVLLQNTYEGIVEQYDPKQKLLGAVNREGVTCFADALLFAMFARLDSFEAMLYDSFNDIQRKKLAGLLRLWVNMLRTGRLITTDITAQLQSALAECGWQEAGRLKQQNPSEAFTFITGQLELPLLTLKMDLYHTGKEDPTDDHKFVNERLLEMAIPDEPVEGSDVITLEQCLEHYFNNRIEVKRHLERRRRDTLKSADSVDTLKVDREPAAHIEVVDVTDLPETPIVQSPSFETPFQTKNPIEKLRPTAGRKRADSIFSQRRVELTGIDPNALQAGDSHTSDLPMRKMSTRTEVLMPAWQFFKLLPWYTDHLPTSDAQVASHFAKKRPMLGICLKRYSYTNEGQARRRNTYVDIPLEIGVPDFVSDDNMEDGAPLTGNFRLMLQSVVCHRGYSVHSGHYVALCRGRAANAQRPESQDSGRGSSEGHAAEDQDSWMRFDDLAKERISYVDIHKALREEMPYLLFYQVVPIDDEGHSVHDLPSYAEATSRTQSDATTNLPEKPYLHEPAGSENALATSTSITPPERKSEATDFAAGSVRASFDVNRATDGPRGRSSVADDGRRPSVTFDTASTSGGSVRTDPMSASGPSTPIEEKGSMSFLGVASKFGSRRGSRVQIQKGSSSGSKSRPTSTGPDSNGNRLSLSMSKLTQRMSRNDSLPIVQPSEAVAVELAGQTAVDEKVAERTPPPVVPATPPEYSVKDVAPPISKPLPKQRKDKAAAKQEKRKSKHHEERDCVIM